MFAFLVFRKNGLI